MLRSITSNGSNPIDHIAFTAGDTLPLQPLSEFNPTTAPQAANVRLFAPMLLGKVAPNYMSKSEAGNSTITLTSGSNTKKPAPGWAIIAAWGSAIEGLARGLAVDLAPSLRVNCVAPGAIRTPLLEKAPENVLQAFREKSLVQDTGSPEDTAEAYLYCMKDRFVTGQVVLTDGGRTLV